MTHGGGGTHISVTCAESICGLTYTDYPNAEDADTVIKHTLILPESLNIAHLAGCGDRPTSRSLSASETTKGKIMPCLRRETRARKGDLVSSAARENSQPADRPSLTEAVWKFVIKFRDDQTRLRSCWLWKPTPSSPMCLDLVITGAKSPDPRLGINTTARFNI